MEKISQLIKKNNGKMANEPPKGIGGWLILVALSLISSTVFTAPTILQMMNIFNTEEYKKLITDGSGSYAPSYANFLKFIVASNIILFAVAVFVAVIFFMKKRIFPRAFIAYMILNIIILIVGSALAQNIELITDATKAEMNKEIIRGILPAFVWIPYMLRSVRVKNTFVK